MASLTKSQQQSSSSSSTSASSAKSQTKQVEARLKQFEFIGRLLAQALIDSRMVLYLLLMFSRIFNDKFELQLIFL
jgi:hypothetical protein